MGERIGVIYTVFSYIIWGLLPIYWKFLGHVSADEILANRVFLVVLVYVACSNRWEEVGFIPWQLADDQKAAQNISSIGSSISACKL